MILSKDGITKDISNQRVVEKLLRAGWISQEPKEIVINIDPKEIKEKQKVKRTRKRDK